MDIYEMMKNGASEEEINEAIHDAIADFSYSFAKQMDAAKERIAVEQAEAAAQKERDKTLREARAYMINSLLAYNDVFQFAPAEEITVEVVAKLEEMIIEMEKELATAVRMIKALGNKMDIEDIWRMFM